MLLCNRRWVTVLLIALIVATITPLPAKVQALPNRDQGLHASSAEVERYPIIFLPGITGSELYNGRELVWVNVLRVIGSHLPIFNLFNMSWLMPLRLAEDGISPQQPGYRIQVGNVMRNGLTDAYSGLFESLRQQGYVEGKDLRLLPYDWRQDPTLATERLDRLVDRTLAETGASQVILLGHSMGGLIARDYVVSGGAHKVKATISLATPWLGVPVAYRALAYGWDFGMHLPGTRWSVLAPRDVKLLAQNFPSVYALSPSRAYFDWYPQGYISRAGSPLTYQQSLEQGMAAHNRALALQGAGYYGHLLDGDDHGVMQFLLVGKGRRTIGGFDERKDWLGFTQMSERFTDGDEVVPLYSGDLGFSKDPRQAERYIGKVVSTAYVQQGHILFAQSTAVHDVVQSWLDVLHGRRDSGFETVGVDRNN